MRNCFKIASALALGLCGLAHAQSLDTSDAVIEVKPSATTEVSPEKSPSQPIAAEKKDSAKKATKVSKKSKTKGEAYKGKSAQQVLALRGAPMSRGGFVRGAMLDMTATAYDESVGQFTRLGTRVCPGTIAVDPRVIPLGTRLYVEGYGEGLACDTGGAIKGHIIDLWFKTRSQALRWGRRRVRVYILGR